MRRKIWKKMLAAGCAASLLVTAPGMTVLADQLQEDEVIETEAEDPGDDVINENGAEQSEDVLEESAEDVITIEEGTEPLSIEEKTVDSVDEAETVGSEEYTVGDGVTATFDEDTGTVEFYSEGGTLSEYWRYKLWDKMEEIKSIKVASGTVFLPEDSDSIFSICYEEYSEGYEGYERYVSNLEEFDSSGFDTSNVTSMYKMFEYCNKLTALDLSNFDTSKVRNMGYMFSGCTDLKNIDLGSFDTSYVTGMYYMFTDCESLTNLDLSSFNTSNVTDMSNMFYECYSLSELNLGSFNTSNVTDMSSMFYYCNSLTNLDLSNFNTSNVTDMSNMFSGCSSLTNLNLSSFDTSNTEYYYNIFYKCKGLISLRTPQKNSLTINLPVAMYDESGAMYSKLPVLSSSITLTGKGNGEILVGDNVIATYDEETGAVEFYSNDGELWNSWLDDSEIDKKAITSIKVASGTVYLPSDSSGIFSVSDYDDDEGRYVSGLIDLDLSGFDTSNVTDMRGMFVGCSSLKNLDLQNFNTSKVTSMWGLFADCESLNELDLSVFDTTNVTSFYHMFSGCTNLISLDISSFVLDSDSMEIDDEDYYTDCLYMFDGCNNLSSVKTPLSNNVCDIALPVVMCDEEGKLYYSLPVMTGSIELKLPSQTDQDYRYNVGEGVTATFDAETGEIVVYSDGGTLWRNWLRQFDKSMIRSIKLAETSDSVYLPADSSEMFHDCYDLINLDLRGFDTSNVTDMTRLFGACYSLEKLDVSGFNTAKVQQMDQMFEECHSLKELDLSSFDTVNVNDMDYMFLYCYSLTDLNLSSFNTRNVRYMNYMFSDCSNLTNLDLSSFDTSNVSSMDMEDMFTGCSALQLLKTPKKNKINVELPCVMYDEAGNAYEELPTSSESIVLTSDVTGEGPIQVGDGVTATFDAETGAVEFYSDGGTLWSNWLEASGIDVTGIRSIKAVSGTVYLPEDSSWIFSVCLDDDCIISNLEELDLSRFDTSNVTNMGYMFRGCNSLTNLDLSSFDTSNVTLMYGMFINCSSLTNLDLSSFDTSNVTEMEDLFEGCWSLTNLNLSSFNTSNVTNMYAMFNDCRNLTNLDLSSFNTSNVTLMYCMFEGCSSLTNLDLSGFETSNAISMWNMFEGCSSLTNLDLSSFDTSNVSYMEDMFSGCSSLQLLKTPKQNTTNVALPCIMYDETGNAYEELPSSSESIVLTRNKPIVKPDISDSEITLSATSYTYDGKAKEPTVTVKNGDAVLTFETDYTVSYADNTNAGTATVKVTGTGNYKGEKSVAFTINKADANLTFAESALTKKTTDAAFTNALTKTTDGTVTFASSDTGVASVDRTSGLVTIKGIGTVIITATASEGQNYKAGSAEYMLTVEDGRVDISGLSVTLSTTSYTYNGKAKKPTVTVKNGDAVLTSGTDYTVSYADNTNAGTATVKVTGTGNYKGEKSVAFTINKADANLTFAESALTKKTTDAAFTNALTKTTDGTVTFASGDTNVATVDSSSGLVTIKGIGTTTVTAVASEGKNYKAGSAEYTLTVEDGRIDISGLTATLSVTSYTYDGKAKEPTVTVKNGSTTLTSGTDYSVSYADNTNAGTATVKVEGTGKYRGEQTKTFTIAKADPKLTFASGSVNKTTLDAAFTNELTKTTDGTVSFTSSDTKVATVDSTNGKVTINGEGTATITATAAEGTNYKSGSAKYTLTVVDGKTDVSELTVSLSATSYTYDGNAKEPAVTVKNGSTTLTSRTDYTVSYSDNTNAGIATAKVTGAGKYKGEKSVTFTINKAEAKLSFAENSLTKKTTDAAFTNTLTKTTDGTVTFKSGNTKVATVDSASGLVTIKGAGTATITASSAEGKNYKAGSASYILTAEAPATPTPTPKPTVSGFSDVQDPNHAYYKAIYWAADAGITKGYPDGTFGIDKSCTRGEMMMFLWRYAGKPAAKAVSKSPFKDVAKNHAFYKAILWGSQKGITKGYPDGTFGINRNVSRGECMMFLWRLKGTPAPKAVTKSPFKDVPKNHAFYNAILWGSQNKVTTGYTSGAKKGTFGINENCTRGQIVTFLYRAK